MPRAALTVAFEKLRAWRPEFELTLESDEADARAALAGDPFRPGSVVSGEYFVCESFWEGFSGGDSGWLPECLSL